MVQTSALKSLGKPASEFVKADSEEAAAVNRVLFKEIERQKYRAKQIVMMMRQEGYSKFNIANHTDL
jgi:hypothetical protein